MNIKRYALSTIVGFVFTLMFDYVVHGVLLVPTYEQTPQLWRPLEEMNNYIPFMNAMGLFVTATLAFIYTRHHEGKGITEDVRFGVMFGLLLGLLQLNAYAWMPISLSLGLSWFAAEFVKTVVLGVIFSLLYKK